MSQLLHKIRIQKLEIEYNGNIVKYEFLIEYGKICWKIQKEYRHFVHFKQTFSHRNLSCPHLTKKGKGNRLTKSLTLIIHEKLLEFLDELLAGNNMAANVLIMTFLNVPPHLKLAINQAQHSITTTESQQKRALELHRAIFDKDMTKLQVN